MKVAATISITSIFAGPAWAEENTYSLYRTSLVNGISKVHIATFDTSNGGDYNFESCQLAAELFQKQPSVKTKFWCEQGRAEDD
ncbi:hypothetical protein [Ruegeria sp. HKCCD7255]|uniref:hypothetical protein n=1 Tax=Ruegeria sp. HKCCD7255 TaxID=2683004 RepID=UPI001489D20A|nr:hypothetical protein [Ruegeria sp. HKCCD7255]